MSDKSKAKRSFFIREYEVLRNIAKGGMGEVYVAIHPTLKKKIILKRLAIRNKEAQDRFLDEAKVMLSFRHKNIVQFFDHFRDNVSTFIAMEYVRGKALNRVIAENERIPIPLAMYILYQIALGLNHAHSKKIIHRDIKPHNVLISRDGHVKITDFGIALKIDELTSDQQKSEVVGTPAYMSPEQLDKKAQVSFSTDIYSLGVVFYEMLTGQRPFKNEYSEEVIESITKGKFLSPGKYTRGIPSVAYKILSKTLNPKISKRFKNLNELLKILKRFFSGYNAGEIRDSIKRLVETDVNINRSPFFVKWYKQQKKKFYMTVIPLIFAGVLASVLGFYYTNGYYEILNSGTFGKIQITFDVKNLNKENLFLKLDNNYEKITDINPIGIYKKDFYITAGKHNISIISGSYKNIIDTNIYSVNDQRKYKIGKQIILIPTEVMNEEPIKAIFTFWNSFDTGDILFNYNTYNDVSSDYIRERNYLSIEENNEFIKMKNYLEKNKDRAFLSGKTYHLMLDKFDKEGVIFNSEDFKITIPIEERWFISNIYLTPLPSTINIESDSDNLPIFLNDNDTGLVYENDKYIYKEYNSIKYVKIGNIYRARLMVPAGNCSIKVLNNGSSLNYKLNSGRVVDIKVEKRYGNYNVYGK